MNQVELDNFWKTLCSLDGLNIDEDIRKLDSVIKRPQFLYRYRSVNENSLNALQNNQMFISTADYYDDPFDTYIKFSREKIYKTVEYMSSDEIINKILSGVNTEISNQIREAIKSYEPDAEKMIKDLVKLREEIQKITYTVCFCEELKNEVLWLKYADNHRGFVLEYNPNSNESWRCGKEENCKNCLLNNVNFNLSPVYYTDEIYDASYFAVYLMAIRTAPNDYIKNFIISNFHHIAWELHKISIIKKKCHEYDREWRIISQKVLCGHPFIKWIPESVTIGLRTPLYQQNMIISASKIAGIKKIRKMYIDENDELNVCDIPQ